jgi:hypothetical protein
MQQHFYREVHSYGMRLADVRRIFYREVIPTGFIHANRKARLCHLPMTLRTAAVIGSEAMQRKQMRKIILRKV